MELKELFEPVIKFIKGLQNKEKENSKDEAKKRLQLVLMQDRASVSPDFFEMMKKEIIEVIKKYIEIDEEALEVQLTRGFEDGLEGPALYANIPIKNIKPVAKKAEQKVEEKVEAEESEEPLEEETLAEEETEVAVEENNEVQENVESEEVKEEVVENKEQEESSKVEENSSNEAESKEEVKTENSKPNEAKKTSNGSKKKNSNSKKKTTNTKK